MSAGGYDGPRMSSDYARQQNGPPIRSTLPNRLPPAPPPAPPRLPYDRRYAPDLTVREGMASAQRPNSYRPDYTAGKYYTRSPSPDPYPMPSRLPEPDPWARNANVWRPPPPAAMDAPNVWPERKIVPHSPTNSGIARGQREDTSSRSFEPSASWVNSRGDRAIRPEHSPDVYGRRGNGSIERPPMAVERPPVYGAGDRYVPTYNAPRRDSFTNTRPGYDSYRPPPSDHGWAAPPRREPVSPASSHHRRDSGSFTAARSLSRHDSPRNAQIIPKKPPPPPASLPANPTLPPSNQHRPASEAWNFVNRVKHSLPPRPPSRSSIASTQVSERKTPVPTPPPPSATVSTPASARSPGPRPTAEPVRKPHLAATATAPAQPMRIKSSEMPPVIVAKPKASPILVDLTQDSVESKIREPDAMDVDTEHRVPHVRVPPIVVSPTGKQWPSNSQIPALEPENVPEEPKRPEQVPQSTAEDAMEQDTDDRLDVPTSRPISPLIIPPVSPAPERIVQDQERVPVPQREPSYPAISPRVPEPTVDIPSSTHSPAHAPTHSPSPIQEVHSPVINDNDLEPSRKTPPVDIPNPEDIPQISELKTAQDALRMVVMTRLLYDDQSREQRVNPVLMANLSIAPPIEVQPHATPETLIKEMSTGEALQKKIDSFVRARPKLEAYLCQRHERTEEKIARLRKEYKTLQERWEVHCKKLNEQQKTLASEHEMQHSGRTTRRSTAITDAVRSDFEMEQIIASLGVDDATDPNCLSARNTAKIPDMISVVKGEVDYYFDDDARRVENPAEYYAPKTGIHDWTEEEKRIFIEKFAAHPKQFGIIADFLENKTAAQCVDFYYLHKHQFIDFRKVVSQFAGNKRRRRGTGKKKGNGLLVDIAIHDMAVRSGAAGSASVAGSPQPSASTRAPRGRKTHPATEQRKPSSRRNAVQFEDTPTSTPTPEPETARTRRKRTVPSTPLASTPVVATPEPDTPGQQDDNLDELDTRPLKRPKRTRKVKSSAVVDDGSPGPEGAVPLPSRRKDRGPAVWSEFDKKMFVKLLGQYGDNFNRISELLPPKTPVQCSNYYANHKYEFGLDTLIANAPRRSPSPASRHRFEKSVVMDDPPVVKVKAPLPGRRTNTQTPAANAESASAQVAKKQPSRPTTTTPASSSSSVPIMNRLDRPSVDKRPSGYPFAHKTTSSGDFVDESYSYSGKNPTYAAMYPPSAVPGESRTSYHRPTTPVSSAPSDTPNIIHSPTGMSPPRPAPPPIPTMTQPYMPPHMHFGDSSHPTYFSVPVPVANPNWPVQPQRYFDQVVFAMTPNGMRGTPTAGSPIPTPVQTAASSSPVAAAAAVAAATAAAGAAVPRPTGNPYPTYGMLPPPAARPPQQQQQQPQQQQQSLPPPPVPYPPPPAASHPSSSAQPAANAAARPVYLPGWTMQQ